MTQQPTPGFQHGAPIVQPAFGPQQIDLVLALVIRIPTLFIEAREHFANPIFKGDGEKPYEMAWGAFCKLYDRGMVVPHSHIWKTEIDSYCNADPVMFPPVLAQRAYVFIDYVYSLPGDMVINAESYARGELHKFLSDRTAVEPLRRVLNESRIGVLADPIAVVKKFADQLTKVDSLASPSVAFCAVPMQKLVQAQKRPTLVTPIDQATGGGVQAGKTYGLFGPVGAFKTGLGVQICVERARSEVASMNMALSRGETYRPGLSVYLTYEAQAEEIQGRVVACGAEIPWDRARDILSDKEKLTYTPQAHHYERARDCQVSEYDRFINVYRELQYLRILDMSGREGNENVGKGGVPEMVSHIDRLVRDTGLPIAQVVIDYAKIAATRYMLSRNLKPEHLRTVLTTMPDEIRRTIAVKFNCPVWVIQQLNTVANRKAAGAPQHHSFASEDGMFGENLFYCFSMSSLNKAQGHTMTLSATKTRETAGLTGPAVLRMNAITNRLEPTEEFVFENNRIVERNIHDVVGSNYQ